MKKVKNNPLVLPLMFAYLLVANRSKQRFPAAEMQGWVLEVHLFSRYQVLISQNLGNNTLLCVQQAVEQSLFSHINTRLDQFEFFF